MQTPRGLSEVKAAFWEVFSVWNLPHQVITKHLDSKVRCEARTRTRTRDGHACRGAAQPPGGRVLGTCSAPAKAW